MRHWGICKPFRKTVAPRCYTTRYIKTIELWNRYDKEEQSPYFPPTNESFDVMPPGYLKPWQQQVSALVWTLQRHLPWVRGSAGWCPGQNQGKSCCTCSCNMFITEYSAFIMVHLHSPASRCHLYSKKMSCCCTEQIGQKIQYKK